MIETPTKFNFIKDSAKKAGDNLSIEEWHDDMTFLRLYKYLHLLFGGDTVDMKRWMRTHNEYLNNSTPEALIITEEGIKDVLNELRYQFYK